MKFMSGHNTTNVVEMPENIIWYNNMGFQNSLFPFSIGIFPTCDNIEGN